MSLRSVPIYARVSNREYVEQRNALRTTARNAGFDFADLWNLMIAEIEKRHANVVKNKAKTELTLAAAVAKVQKEAVKARMEIETERAQIAKGLTEAIASS